MDFGVNLIHDKTECRAESKNSADSLAFFNCSELERGSFVIECNRLAAVDNSIGVAFAPYVIGGEKRKILLTTLDSNILILLGRSPMLFDDLVHSLKSCFDAGTSDSTMQLCVGKRVEVLVIGGIVNALLPRML